MAYTYKSPIESGFVKFKLSRKQHNEILFNRKKKYFTKIEAYYSENSIRFEYTTKLTGKILSLLLLPYTLLVHGLSSIGEIVEECKDMFNEKKTGSFLSEHCNKKKYNGDVNERFLQLEEIYKKQVK